MKNGGERFLIERKRAIQTVQAPSVIREEPDLKVPSSSRISVGSGTIVQLNFIILDET